MTHHKLTLLEIQKEKSLLKIVTLKHFIFQSCNWNSFSANIKYASHLKSLRTL